MNKEIGLWATPATWQQQYRHCPLEALPNVGLSQLIGRGWTVVPAFIKATANLLK